LRAIAGAEVAEYFALDEPVPVHAAWSGTQEGESRLWAELLRPLTPETEVLATFGPSNGWLDGGAMATRHRVGERGGQVVMVGGWLDAALLASLTEWLLQETGVTPVFAGAPEGVEVARRVDANGKAVTLVINHSRQETTLTLPGSGNSRTDLLTGEEFGETVTLPGYGVRVWSDV
jgi:beta-galactosidase GanA